MANENSEAPTIGLHDVGNCFAHRYYDILLKNPSLAHRFYQEESQLSCPDHDGKLVTVTSMQKINDLIMAKDYSGYQVQIANIDCQSSQMGGVIVVVTGTWRGRETSRTFSETFFLAPQEKGYYVLNHIFRYVDEPAAITHPELEYEGEPVSSKPLKLELSPDVDDALEDGEEASLQTIQVTPGQDVVLVQETAESLDQTEEKKVVVAEITVAAIPEEVEAESKPDTGSKIEDVPGKITYAKMAAKEVVGSGAQVPLNRVVVVAHSSTHFSDKFGPPKPKSNSENDVVNKKLQSLINKDGKDINKDGKDVKDGKVKNRNTERRGIFIGDLPHGIEVEQLREIFKKFGVIKKNGVQVKSYSDGFTFGFVEFDTASAASDAITARHIKIGEKQAYITEKKTSNKGYDNNSNGGNGNNGGRGRSLSGNGDGGAIYNRRSPSGEPTNVGGVGGGYNRRSPSGYRGDGSQARPKSSGSGNGNHDGYNYGRANYGEGELKRNRLGQAWIQNNKGQSSDTKAVAKNEAGAPTKVNGNGAASTTA